MAINTVLIESLKRGEEIRREQDEYQAKCARLGMGTDEKALEKIVNTINSLELSEETKEVMCDHINSWYGCYESEY